MRVWRGIFTSAVRERVAEPAFGRVPRHLGNPIPLLLSKILENQQDGTPELILTSFTTDHGIAIRYAGGRGWVVEIEVDPAQVLFPEASLERALAAAGPGTEAYERIDEALQMVRRDCEVFLYADDEPVQLVDIAMVGALEQR